MNLYFDKFFALFTIAFPILMGMFLVSLLGWISSMTRTGRNKFLQTHLVRPQALDADADDDKAGLSDVSDKRLVDAFHREFLLKDGIFALELIKVGPPSSKQSAEVPILCSVVALLRGRQVR